MKHVDDATYWEMYKELSDYHRQDLKNRWRRYHPGKEWIADALIDYYQTEYDDYLMERYYLQKEEEGVNRWRGL